MKITTTNKSITTLTPKYTRLVLAEGQPGHRFTETENGITELRFNIGKKKEIDSRKFRTLARDIVRTAQSHKIEHLAIELPKRDEFSKLIQCEEEWFLATLVENSIIAGYEFLKYKTKLKNKVLLKEVILCGLHSANTVNKAITIGEYVNIARDIANTAGDDMTPKVFAETIVKLAKNTKVKVTVYDDKRIRREKLNALWAVGKGANDLPRFVIMKYMGGKAAEAPIVLAGKGVTYDTGGLNTKPVGFMHDMHLDMSGGSAVAASILAAAKLGIKKNVIGLIPVAENAISEKSMRAGDIISSHSGKTIEVLHTDAEGRLILADALSYSHQYKPRAIVDVATLTGASLVALGQMASALMGNNDELCEALKNYGEETGDYVWQLPLWNEYKAPLTQTKADLINIQPNFSKFGGAIEGGAFLSFFVPKGVPWAHLDIAPRMDAAPHDKLAKGSTGEPVRLLVKFIEKY